MTGATLSARRAVWSDGWIVPLLEQAGLLGPAERERMEEVGGRSAWRACLEAGVAEDAVLAAVAQRFRMPAAAPADLVAADPLLLPGEAAVRLRVVPLDMRGHVLQIACADPVDLELEQAVAFAAGCNVRLQLASPTAIDAALATLYPGTAVG